MFGFNSINTDDDYGRLVEFLSQVLKLSYLILWCITSFPFRFCANAVAHLCLQYVLRFAFRHQLAFQADSSHRLTQALIFSPHSNCTYNSQIIKNESFLAYFMRILNSCVVKYVLSTMGISKESIRKFLIGNYVQQVWNCQPWVFVIPAAYLLIDCYSTRHSRSLVFLQLWTALT